MTKDDIMVFIGDLLVMNMDMLLKALVAFGVNIPMIPLYIIDAVLLVVLAFFVVDTYGIQKKWILKAVVLFNLFHVLLTGVGSVVQVEGATDSSLYFLVLLLEASIAGIMQCIFGYISIRLFERRLVNRGTTTQN